VIPVLVNLQQEVGDEEKHLNRLELLAPWIGLASLMKIVAVGALVLRRRMR
jgi:hypothetical protein